MNTYIYIYRDFICIDLHFVMLCIPLLKVCPLISTANTKITVLSGTEMNDRFSMARLCIS